MPSPRYRSTSRRSMAKGREVLRLVDFLGDGERIPVVAMVVVLQMILIVGGHHLDAHASDWSLFMDESPGMARGR